jgi:hypothetical protein
MAAQTHDLKMAAHLLMLVRWLTMPKMGPHFIVEEMALDLQDGS